MKERGRSRTTVWWFGRVRGVRDRGGGVRPGAAGPAPEGGLALMPSPTVVAIMELAGRVPGVRPSLGRRVVVGRVSRGPAGAGRAAPSPGCRSSIRDATRFGPGVGHGEVRPVIGWDQSRFDHAAEGGGDTDSERSRCWPAQCPPRGQERCCTTARAGATSTRHRRRASGSTSCGRDRRRPRGQSCRHRPAGLEVGPEGPPRLVATEQSVVDGLVVNRFEGS
ncbi:hypothetical protein SAMN05192558_10416 [Actinokineospora alba]|uniref:Uncharacterized protein n=1 Tax=Actinokineospora alba TaxID=504798 RepID=A0A1H0L5T0_9PSEU|nr:hypothetical protein C8E96_2735 [Actinokineospora alba]SDJ04494.1 hypothetical protein SAMN05421871_109283 [Actinokineospora alba]SDO63320.1 hypothetical protein SAMN05192558_10416 [Actinokineospora alba]